MPDGLPRTFVMEANAAELVERANCARMASARAAGEEPEGDEPVHDQRSVSGRSEGAYPGRGAADS